MAMEGDADVARPLWQSFGQKVGLPQNSINTILQTRDGYLWLGTNGGLARFDGSVVSTPFARQLPSLRITALFEDAAGKLWVGTEDRGLFVLGDGESGHLDLCGRKCQVNDIVGSAEGEVLVITTDRIFALAGERVVRELGRMRAGGVFGHFHVAGRREVYVGWQRGLGVFSGREIAPIPLPGGETDVGDFAVTEDSLWVVGKGGLYRRDRHGGEWTPVLRATGIAVEAVHGASGVVMVSVRGKGVYEIAGRDGAMRFMGAPMDAVITFAMIDDEGNRWVGTDTEGLWKVAEPKVELLQDSKSGIPYAGRAIAPDGGGGVWMGFACGGVARLAQDGDLIEYGEETCVNGILPISPGRALVTTDANALLLAERGQLQALASWDGSPSLRVWRSKDGTRWMAKNSGLHTFELLPGDTGIVLGRPLAGTAGLKIAKLVDSRRGGIWILSDEGAWRLLDGRVVQKIGLPGKASTVLARDLVEGSRGDVWVATYGNGLLHDADGKVEVVDERAGLVDTALSCVFEDGDANIWVAGNLGMTVLRKRTGGDRGYTWLRFDETDGLRPAEANGGNQTSCFQDARGGFWVSLMRGFARIDPRKALAKVPAGTRTYIESVSVDGAAKPVAGELHLDARQRSVEIGYTGISLMYPERVEFRFRFGGPDKPWIDMRQARNVILAEVPWGRRPFEVQSRIAGGEWSTSAVMLIAKPVPWFNHPLLWGCLIAVSLMLLVWTTRDPVIRETA